MCVHCYTYPILVISPQVIKIYDVHLLYGWDPPIISSTGNIVIGAPVYPMTSNNVAIGYPPGVTLEYGGRFFVGHSYPPDLLSPNLDALKQVLNTGTLADFQNWLVQSVVPADNYSITPLISITDFKHPNPF